MSPSPPELLPGLPRTFAPALSEKIKGWRILFPAERRAIGAQMDWLAHLPAAEFQSLFAPINALEAKMDLPPWNARSERVSINDTGILVRSPYYPQWRVEVEKVFARIDSALDSTRQPPPNKLVVCAMPGGVRTDAKPFRASLEKEGVWVQLRAPFEAALPTLFQSVGERPPARGAEPIERTWVFEYGGGFAQVPAAAAPIALSFDGMAALRREFLARLNSMSRDIRMADRVYEDLRGLDLSRFLESRPVEIREFVRSVFLSGNGALLFGNSFVQWGAAEAMRRAQPQALFCVFGIRPKLKPFSSVVLFEDQNRANPTPDQPDPEGSFVDARILAEYVHLAAKSLPEYAGRSLEMFAAPGETRVLVVGPSAALAGLLDPPRPLDAADLASAARRWLA